MAFFDPVLDIALITIVTVTISRLLQLKFVSPKAMDKLKKLMKKKQEEMKKLLKKDPESKEVQKTQNEMMQINAEIMKKTMPGMLVSMPVILLIYWFVLPIYAEDIIPLAIPLPWIDGQLHNTTNYLGWYIIVALISGIILNLIIKKFYADK